MGTNFHTPYADVTTLFKASSMNPALASLDQGITYQKNVIVTCDGRIYYNRATGVLTWTDTLRFFFNRSDGQAIQNTVAAGSITLSDNQFAYVNLSETNGQAISVSQATLTTGIASNFITYNRIVLGYRDTVSDNFYPVYLAPTIESIIHLTSAGAVTINWNLGSTAKIILSHDVAFTFSGGYDGQKLVLRIKQDGTGHRVPTWPTTIRYGSDILNADITEEPGHGCYLGFIYDSYDSRYDLVSKVCGFGIAGS